MFGHLTGLEILYVLVAVIVSVGFHEAMHGFIAFKLGDRTAADLGRITLNPLAHVDIFATVLLPLLLIISGLPPFFAAKPVPFNPARVKWDEYGAALVGLAGPLTNLVLAAAAGGIYRLAPYGAAGDFLSIFTAINVALFVFNMIPFPPLDGSRLLYAFAPEALRDVMARIEQLGLVAILIFMVLFFNILGPTVINIDQHLINLLLG
ncbi:MAG TPA: site-2 protease family protein [Candidatus Saccharimonadales bacterium]|nr:site-2 protease family protein [Candidatus Saccharimonadales bacterium]